MGNTSSAIPTKRYVMVEDNKKKSPSTLNKPDVFKGDCEKFTFWLADIEAYIEYCNEKSDADKNRVVFSFLGGDAKRWITALQERNFWSFNSTPYARTKELLQESYGTKNVISDDLKAYKELKQAGEYAQVARLNSKFKELMTRTNKIDDLATREDYFSKLTTPLRNALITTIRLETQSLDHIMREARETYNNLVRLRKLDKEREYKGKTSLEEKKNTDEVEVNDISFNRDSKFKSWLRKENRCFHCTSKEHQRRSCPTYKEYLLSFRKTKKQKTSTDTSTETSEPQESSN